MTSLPTQIDVPPEGQPISIESPNYWLRSLGVFDAGAKLLGWLNDAQMLEGLNLDNLNFTPESLRQFIEGFNNRNSYILGIFSKDQEAMIGFLTIDIDHRHRMGRLTAGLGDKTFWGKDVFYEIGLALRDFFFAHRDVEKLSAYVLEHNRRMIFNFIGSPDYAFEACLKKECRMLDGTRADLLVFSALKENWPSTSREDEKYRELRANKGKGK